MPRARVNDIELAYDWHGPANGPVIVLIQGLGMPSTAWPPMFIDLLTQQDFRVLTFDNRDIGQSQIIEAKVPNLAIQMLRMKLRLRVKAPYQLTDMMLDTEALLAELGIDTAHVVGISMGGMIAQLLAIHAPQRVNSLVSLMSTTGDRHLPGPTREVSRHIISRPATGSDEDRIAFSMKTWQLICSPSYPTPEATAHDAVRRIYERGITPAGIARQILAILATPGRTPQLRELEVPTLVIHGDADPLVPLTGGRATARAIPGAKMEIIPGMAHDLPAQLMPRITRSIGEHIRSTHTRSSRAHRGDDCRMTGERA